MLIEVPLKSRIFRILSVFNRMLLSVFNKHSLVLKNKFVQSLLFLARFVISGSETMRDLFTNPFQNR